MTAMVRVIGAEDPLGDPLVNDLKTVYAFDVLDRLDLKTEANGDVTDYEYDLVGNLTSLVDPAEWETVWTHDGLNRVVSEELVGAGGGIVPPSGPGGGGGSNPTRTYEYDQVGNLTKYVDRNDRTTEYEHDALHRRTQEEWLDGFGSTIRTFSVGYDAASQMTTASDPSASYTFDYDDLGRVFETTGQFAAVGVSVDDPLYRFTADFDLQGNRTSLSSELMDYSLATPDYVDDFLTTYDYDALHRMIRGPASGARRKWRGRQASGIRIRRPGSPDGDRPLRKHRRE